MQNVFVFSVVYILGYVTRVWLSDSIKEAEKEHAYKQGKKQGLREARELLNDS